jgi:hypothetical protein
VRRLNQPVSSWNLARSAGLQIRHWGPNRTVNVVSTGKLQFSTQSNKKRGMLSTLYIRVTTIQIGHLFQTVLDGKEFFTGTKVQRLKIVHAISFLKKTCVHKYSVQ